MKRLAVEHAVYAVRDALSGHTRGMCYVASEAVYWLAGGKAAGLTPMQVWMETGPGLEPRVSHWFLRGPAGQVIDLTADQYAIRVPYEEARGRGFLTKYPSRRAYALLDVVETKGETR